ncbi:hypothetical protein [Cellvibrio sp. UBA7661]|uniref:hypothetical protein n=1 Tax=Cellvibrio sp. UBA7661 TaxID=1946311 RepID=UPI002F35642D
MHIELVFMQQMPTKQMSMTKCLIKKTFVTQGAVNTLAAMLLLGAPGISVAATDRFSLTLGAQEYWDSNFARSADTDSEHYTHLYTSLALKERFSKQNFSLNASANRYEYAEREDLDANFYEGQASWRSDWNRRVKTSVAWTRDAYAVDRLEFADKDIVALENLQGQITLNANNSVGFVMGVRQAEQTHSNDLRESLNFDEEEWFAAGTYTTANQSSLGIRLRDGERLYLQPVLINPDRNVRVLDFEYRQLALEGVWAFTRKTRMGFTAGRFKREGDINEGTGTQALVDFEWNISNKLNLALSYSQSEPAVGETSDSPADIRTSKVVLSWEPSAKWSLSMDASYSDLAYLARLDDPARDENITIISPLRLTYRLSDSLAIRMNSQWVDRESPLLYRDYDYALAAIGFNFTF